MQHIQGICRHQLQITSLEDKITLDNLVRLDAFVTLNNYTQRVKYNNK
ncbi:hypothetical protein SL054_002007 [Flavobacterium psychrophilum]|nr:hypothetical protein [Flavobacterium psychrophilum]EKT4499501.1 hypothetical protein [Flavobacterium psychrophilum]ELM3651232.1 hypothetical protein [Flavobacterium psychrophilum]ELM3671902.1 hypothetical protein [Flavobacterium psychrophilum]ELM3725866.1 hypothetical protein [Flavobacterium psychrophilum]ELY1992655.1 hypothetical protein [Flavobacterium psychrophilum]